MVAFNFTVNIGAVVDGSKLSTIRKTKRCSVGDTMQFYEAQRTKACHKLRNDAKCVGTARIVISAPCHWYLDEVCGDVKPNNQPLHEQEGFQNMKDFVGFFKEHYGLPFRGWLHVWEKNKEAKTPSKRRKTW